MLQDGKKQAVRVRFDGVRAFLAWLAQGLQKAALAHGAAIIGGKNFQTRCLALVIIGCQYQARIQLT